MFEFDSLSRFIIPILLTLVPILWVWAFADMVKNRKLSSEPVAVWILIIFLFPIVGSILYFQISRRRLADPKKGFNPDFRR